MSGLRELYQEVIIDHNKCPRNFCKLSGHSHYAEGLNPLCGDRISLYLDIQQDKIERVSFEGSGCAISTASASLMTEMLKGKDVEEAKKLFSVFHALLTGQEASDEGDDIGKLQVLAGVKEYPARVKCATLAWHALMDAMSGAETHG
ncbi:MAG: SUF system NifU family Fe-S cluster assembly protein [Gammaproteobacteria bacterium]|nr:SUF system NifU family Fe-S cluster assembly protein [Gammaproteobacteria bacterium]